MLCRQGWSEPHKHGLGTRMSATAACAHSTDHGSVQHNAVPWHLVAVSLVCLPSYYISHRCKSTISTHSIEAQEEEPERLGVSVPAAWAHGKREGGCLKLSTQALHGSRSARTIQ